MIEVVAADWPAPPQIRAIQTTRVGGVSGGAYDSLNLGSNTGDDPAAVRANRQHLREGLKLLAEPCWLRQVHGTRVVDAAQCVAEAPAADASETTAHDVVCAVLTADCLPVLLCADDGSWIGAAHAGWRGLVAGVLEAVVARSGLPPSRLLAWFGAAIGPAHFEVGPEVRDAFVAAQADARAAFRAGRDDRWHADLYALARLRLQRAGVQHIYGGGLCTYADAVRFYSFRREPDTGRMATLIWRAALPD
ncbi:MAG TPA: peptidoglycan editing factor PgeF [Solimonas sp.]